MRRSAHRHAVATLEVIPDHGAAAAAQPRALIRDPQPPSTSDQQGREKGPVQQDREKRTPADDARQKRPAHQDHEDGPAHEGREQRPVTDRHEAAREFLWQLSYLWFLHRLLAFCCLAADLGHYSPLPAGTQKINVGTR